MSTKNRDLIVLPSDNINVLVVDGEVHSYRKTAKSASETPLFLYESDIDRLCSRVLELEREITLMKMEQNDV